MFVQKKWSRDHSIGVLSLIGAFVLLALGLQFDEAILLVVSVFAFAFSANYFPSTRSYSFGLWVVSFVAAAMIEPKLFLKWGSIRCGDLVPPLIQFAMFGMGATLRPSDFTRVLKMPAAVGVGVALQYTVMPLTGYFVAMCFMLPKEIAAGVLLVGCCPGGVSSNVITYLAKGNVALSVTLTACSTLIAPIMTPLTMYLLGGQLIEVPVYAMMINILWIVIVPIVAGLVANMVLEKCNFRGAWVDRWLSRISMSAICLICALITASSRDKMLNVGPALVLAVAAHNSLGYLFGYWACRILGMDERTRRTVAIEVGLQNGGMAAQLATDVLKSANAALAAVVFAPWMNLSGSLLAAWWHRSAYQLQDELASSKIFASVEASPAE